MPLHWSWHVSEWTVLLCASWSMALLAIGKNRTKHALWDVSVGQPQQLINHTIFCGELRLALCHISLVLRLAMACWHWTGLDWILWVNLKMVPSEFRFQCTQLLCIATVIHSSCKMAKNGSWMTNHQFFFGAVALTKHGKQITCHWSQWAASQTWARQTCACACLWWLFLFDWIFWHCSNDMLRVDRQEMSLLLVESMRHWGPVPKSWNVIIISFTHGERFFVVILAAMMGLHCRIIHCFSQITHHLAFETTVAVRQLTALTRMPISW